MATATVYSKDGADAAIAAAVAGTVKVADKGVPSGVASLDATGKVPTSQVPALPYATESELTGKLGTDELPAQGVAITLIWDGTDYQPSALKATTERPKLFVGPIDPATASGVVLADLDSWNRTA